MNASGQCRFIVSPCHGEGWHGVIRVDLFAHSSDHSHLYKRVHSGGLKQCRSTPRNKGLNLADNGYYRHQIQHLFGHCSVHCSGVLDPPSDNHRRGVWKCRSSTSLCAKNFSRLLLTLQYRFSAMHRMYQICWYSPSR